MPGQQGALCTVYFVSPLKPTTIDGGPRSMAGGRGEGGRLLYQALEGSAGRSTYENIKSETGIKIVAFTEEQLPKQALHCPSLLAKQLYNFQQSYCPILDRLLWSLLDKLMVALNPILSTLAYVTGSSGVFPFLQLWPYHGSSADCAGVDRRRASRGGGLGQCWPGREGGGRCKVSFLRRGAEGEEPRHNDASRPHHPAPLLSPAAG